MNITEEKRFIASDQHWWFAVRRELTLRLVLKYLKPGSTILDAGSGSGDVAVIADKNGYRVICVDVSKKAVEKCQKKGLEAIHGDLMDLPFQDEVFDLILALDVIEHVHDDNKALVEMNRTLKQDGILIINVPAFKCLWSPHDEANKHFRRYERKEIITKLKSTNFKPIKRFYWNNALYLPAMLVRWGKTILKISGDDLLINPANQLFKILVGAETRVAERIPFPYGISEMVVAEKC